MSERQRSIIGPVCTCGEETVLCFCGLRLCLASLTGGRGRSIRASCFDTAQKRLWLWLLQSEHWPTVYHHTWQGKADHEASHTQTHITNFNTVSSLLLNFWPEFWKTLRLIFNKKIVHLLPNVMFMQKWKLFVTQNPHSKEHRGRIYWSLFFFYPITMIWHWSVQALKKDAKVL